MDLLNFQSTYLKPLIILNYFYSQLLINLIDIFDKSEEAGVPWLSYPPCRPSVTVSAIADWLVTDWQSLTDWQSVIAVQMFEE